jgi:hypothetical protein
LQCYAIWFPLADTDYCHTFGGLHTNMLQYPCADTTSNQY